MYGRSAHADGAECIGDGSGEKRPASRIGLPLGPVCALTLQAGSTQMPFALSSCHRRPLSPSRFIPRHADLDAALKRLSGALDLLEAATARLDRAGAERRDVEEALAAMEDDRGRLADDLDAALTRAQILEQAAGEVATRLRTAGVALRQILAADGSGLDGGRPS